MQKDKENKLILEAYKNVLQAQNYMSEQEFIRLYEHNLKFLNEENEKDKREPSNSEQDIINTLIADKNIKANINNIYAVQNAPAIKVLRKDGLQGLIKNFKNKWDFSIQHKAAKYLENIAVNGTSFEDIKQIVLDWILKKYEPLTMDGMWRYYDAATKQFESYPYTEAAKQTALKQGDELRQRQRTQHTIK